MRFYQNIIFLNHCYSMYARRRVARPKRRIAKKRMGLRKKSYRRPIPRAIITNTAAVKETYSVPVMDGNVTFFRSTSLADAVFDRAQTVASAFQEFRVKYIKLTFRPNADTFPAVAGNSIPQLYFMIDKANSIPTNADSNTFFSMGARPRRMDDKNLTYIWAPTALVSTLIAPNVTTTAEVKLRPWLSTNANSQNPGAAWAPNQTDHLGCAFYVTKINPADALEYNVDVEVVFQFRKPVWKGGSSSVNNQMIDNGELKPIPTSNTV